jgi:hypothetical protein
MYKMLFIPNFNEEESGLSICGTMFYYIWRACEVGPRMVVLALFASEFHYYFLIGLAGHWIAMCIWVTLLKPNCIKCYLFLTLMYKTLFIPNFIGVGFLIPISV